MVALHTTINNRIKSFPINLGDLKMAELKLVSTEDLMAELKSRGKFVDNLWTTDDVKSRFDCTEEEAQEVLYEALTNERTMEQIWVAIDFHGNENGLTINQL